MGDPAFALGESALAQQAVQQTVKLTLIQGGLSAGDGAGAAALGSGAAAAEVGTGLAAAEVGTAAAAAGAGAGIGLGTVLAFTGIGLAVIAVGALGYYLYTRSKKANVPPPPKAVTDCPGNPVEPVVKPVITPKPVPDITDPRIPEVGKQRIKAQKEAKRQQRCPELWESIQRRANNRRKKPGDDIQGLKYRYWDNICSEKDPNTAEGSKTWDDHQEAFEADQRGLAKDIQEFEENCDGDLPDGAKEWSEKGYPDKSEWRGNSPECIEYRRVRQKRYDDNK
jgi:hypothetical protein